MFWSRDVKPRKRSYYAFSKNYPSRRTGTTYAIGETRARREKERRANVAYALALVVVFLLTFAAAFVGISLYERPVESDGAAAPFDGTYHALYITPDELGGGIAFDLFADTLAESGANAVLLDYKGANGRLCTQADEAAGEIGASAATNAAADTVARLKAQGCKILARVYCFCDPLAASQLPGTAVTESDGVSVWLDGSARSGGQPWLNPYSETAQDYLLAVIASAVEFGADVVVLDAVQFPTGERAAQATFPGEAESTYSRNAVLQRFIERAKEAARGVPLAVSMPLSAAVAGDAAAYGGGIFDSAADFAAVELTREGLADGAVLGGTAYAASMDDAAFFTAAASAVEARLADNYRTSGVLYILPAGADASLLSGASEKQTVRLRETAQSPAAEEK